MNITRGTWIFGQCRFKIVFFTYLSVFSFFFLFCFFLSATWCNKKEYANEEADKAAKEATSFSSNVIRRRIPYRDLVVTLHHTEKQSWNKVWNTSKKTNTHNITQDFDQTMSTHNMKIKDRIVTTRLRTGTLQTHAWVAIKKKKQNPQCVSNATEFYQPIVFYSNAASTTLKVKKYRITSPAAMTSQKTLRKCPELSKGN